MEFAKWIFSLFDVEGESANLDTFRSEEFTEITFDREGKSVYTFKVIGYYWMKVKNFSKIYQVLCYI